MKIKMLLVGILLILSNRADDVKISVKLPNFDYEKYYVYVARDNLKFIRSLCIFTNTDFMIGNCVSGTYKHYIVGETKEGFIIPFPTIVTNISTPGKTSSPYVVIQMSKNYILMDLSPFFSEHALEMENKYPPLPSKTDYVPPLSTNSIIKNIEIK